MKKKIYISKIYKQEAVRERLFGFARRLSENAIFPKPCVMLKKLSSEYQPYACGNFFSQSLILEKIAILGQPPGPIALRLKNDLDILLKYAFGHFPSSSLCFRAFPPPRCEDPCKMRADVNIQAGLCLKIKKINPCILNYIRLDETVRPLVKIRL